ncbi:xpg i-region protein [Niveomyces insectorum RCEF 264]|uniref:Xpg i-region protein n=1 Tax=Niveomyces insectorum RCEF 264 TaxID=1081102 RepID=A0A167Z3B4_9HYPO|nr:xpg i-region protein [Niveomyces insectorum RCEF 264]
MPAGPYPLEDPFIAQQLVTYDVSDLDGCAIAVDATYFIQHIFNNTSYHEPLMSALSGLTGFTAFLEKELDQWAANNLTPLFVFNGQPVVGQDDMSIANGLRDIARTDTAWQLYSAGRADEAVANFGSTGSTYQTQPLYPLFQRLLRKRNLHFLVPPYNASAQIAHLDMTDSDQCAGIMGAQELLLYPIHDSVIHSINWETRTVAALSKKLLIKNLNVSDTMFTDMLLMTGTSFLPPFPPLRDASVTPRQPSIMDASNMLRTSEKNVANVCASFNDILQAQDPNWLDKFRKARMVVDHFIYIAESGEVCVHGIDKLTGDNHEYLGFQLPSEYFHYLNKGLIGPRVLSWITHCQVTILPTLDGFVSDEYRNLVTKQLVPYFETALGLVITRLNRGLHYQNIVLKVWYDNKFSLKLNHRNEGNQPSSRIDGWNVTTESIERHFAKPEAGSIAFELSALKNRDFVSSVLQAPKSKNIESADTIVSLAVWKLLVLRGYATEKTFELTVWGEALAKTFAALEPVARRHPDGPALNAAALLAFELLRLGLLNSRNQHAELQGFPANGTDDDKNCVVLISRVAALLQLRQNTTGYTGPLSKNVLAFHSLAKTVGEANRALIEAVLAHTFMNGQAKRQRSDLWEIGHRLPFIDYSDAALGIAVKTFLDENALCTTPEARAALKAEFPQRFVPHATHLFEDFDAAFGLVEAVYAGIETLSTSDLKAEDRVDWDKAKNYLERRK